MSKELQAELVAKALGREREPEWSMVAPTNVQLAIALNHYNVAVENEQLRKWTAKHLAKRHDRELLDAIESAPAWKFRTEAALLRMQSRGCLISERHAGIIASWLDSLRSDHLRRLAEENDKKAAKPVRRKLDVNLRAYDSVLDDVLLGRAASPDYDVKKPMTGVIATIQSMLADEQAEPGSQDKRMIRWAKEQLRKLTSIATPQTKTVRKKRLIDPVKATKNIHFDPAGMTPAQLLGKKRAWIRIGRWKLMMYVEAEAGGFRFSGQRLDGVNWAASKQKRYRDKELAAFPQPRSANRYWETAFKACKQKQEVPDRLPMHQTVMICYAE